MTADTQAQGDLIALAEKCGAQQCGEYGEFLGFSALAQLEAFAAALQGRGTQEGEHRQGCEALGGYGHGVGPCTCGAQEGEPSDAMVQAYLDAQRAAVEEADKFGRPNVGGLHTNTVREACRAGIRAALAQAQKERNHDV